MNGMNLSTTFQKKMSIDSFPFSFELENRERKTGTKGKRGRIYFLVGQQFPISRYALFLGGMRESAFVNFLEQSHDAAGGWPRYGEPPAVV